MKRTIASVCFLLLLAWSGQATTTVTVDELTCALNLTSNGVNIPDETVNHPLIVASKQATTIEFQITDAALEAQVFVTIVKSSMTFTPYDWTGDTTGSVLLLADVLNAVTVAPGAFAGCVGAPGCDGMQVDMIAFQKLFAPNTTYVLFSCVVQYSSNGSVTLGLSPFMTLGIMRAQAANTVIGTSDPITTNITFASTITPTPGTAAAAAASSGLSTAAIVGMAVGIPLGVLALILLACWGMTHSKARGDTPVKRGGREYGSSSDGTELTGTEGFYAGKFKGNLNHRLTPHHHYTHVVHAGSVKV